MKVKDLMEFLRESDPELSVFMSSDAEGNHFRAMSLAQEGATVITARGRVEVYNVEDAPKDSKPCIVLWPE